MSRRGFGRTWWGGAWVEALEQRARLDPNRLPRGRTYARSGAVGELTIAPGLVTAPVQGRRVRPYSVVVRVRAFDAGEWDRVDTVAAQVGRTAALLDGELPPEVAADVAAAGLDLLPGPGEVGPRCSCPDWADPCKHAAAVCYLVADMLDADPFALLLLRGRTREEVLAGLRGRRRTAGGAAGPEQAATPARDEGVDARLAYATPPADLPPLPSLPLPPMRPGRPAVLAVDPPAGAGVWRDDLVALAADTAARAWELCTGAGDGGLTLDLDADLARRAAAVLGGRGFAGLAARTGVPGRELLRTAAAWRHGGAGGVEVTTSAWAPRAGDLAEGRAALASAGRVRAWRNRLTCEDADRQLRLGRDGLWYRFERVADEWELTGPPDPDPAVLLRAADPRRPEIVTASHSAATSTALSCPT